MRGRDFLLLLAGLGALLVIGWYGGYTSVPPQPAKPAPPAIERYDVGAASCYVVRVDGQVAASCIPLLPGPGTTRSREVRS